MADGFEFADFISEREEARTAFKQLAAKVCSQTETNDRDIKFVDRMRQMCNLRVGQELCFVQKYTGDIICLAALDYDVEQVRTGVEQKRILLQTDAGGDNARGATVVDSCGELQRVHAALAVVEARLQKRCRFAGIHGGVVEVKLGHSGRFCWQFSFAVKSEGTCHNDVVVIAPLNG